MLSPNVTPDPALRERLLRLLDQLDHELDQDNAGERTQRRWSVQAPVLIGTFPEGVAPPPHPDNAHEMNFPFSRQFKLRCHGWATDLSENGLGLLTEAPLEANAYVHISLQALLDEPLVVPVRIIYIRQIFAHTFRAGAQFVLD